MGELGGFSGIGKRVYARDEKHPSENLLVESVLRVRSKERGLPFLRPNRAQREFANRCSKRNIVLKARQLGMTTFVAARFFIRTISNPGTVTLQVAHDRDAAEAIFRIVHRFYDGLPQELRCGALIRSRANVGQMVFKHLDSEYRVASAADPNAGRGMTIHNLHCSEVASWPGDALETLASLRSAVPTSGEIVLESTPKGVGGTFYEEWHAANETGYTRHFFPWWYDSSYQLFPACIGFEDLNEEERLLFRSKGLTLEQIAWRRQNRAQLRGLAVQEFAEDAESCFLASGECVFDLGAIDTIRRGLTSPFNYEDNGRLQIFFPPAAGKRYILGADPAGGGADGDYACGQVIDRETGLQCAEIRGHFSPREFAIRIGDLARRYNEALLVVERNNHGHAVLAYFESHPYGNLFERGWTTTSITRPLAIELLAETIVNHHSLIRSVQLIAECRTFVRFGDGSTGAQSGTHDDCVMAMGIALAARQKVAGRISTFA